MGNRRLQLTGARAGLIMLQGEVSVSFPSGAFRAKTAAQD
jgi:hypothetical protein